MRILKHSITTATARWLATCAIALAPAVAVHAQEPAPGELSLEELMGVTVEPVFGASRRLQPVTEAPASVTIITAEDIATHGYRTLGEIIASLRGFHTTYDRNYTYIGTRGFALPGDYNSRVLLLVDGHRINDSIYQQAMPGRELGMDVFTFERVEIIRGPASSLYGTSAFFAVINIVTKSGAQMNDVAAQIEGGSLGTRIARVAGGRRFANGVDFAVTAAVGASEGNQELYYPEFDTPGNNGGIASGIDDEGFRQLFGRVTLKDVTITGMAGDRDKSVPTASYDSVFGDPRFATSDQRQYVDMRYERDVKGTQVTAQTFIDRYRYDGTYPSAFETETGEMATSVLHDFAEGRWWGFEGRVSRRVGGRHELTAGTEYRHNYRENQGGEYDVDPDSSFLMEQQSHVAAIYGQDEIEISNRLFVTAGARYDRHSGFDRVTPRLAVVVKSSENQAFKYLYGNAFRAPNAYESDYYSQPFRRIDLKPERIASHELVWERYSARWLRTSVSFYSNTIADLIGFFSADNGDYGFENLQRVRAKGLEFEAEARHRSGLVALGSYVLQDAADDTSGSRLTNSPRHAAKLQVSAPGPARSTIAFNIQHLSERLALDGESVGSATLAAITARVPLSKALSLNGSIYNLFDNEYFDAGSAEHLQRAIQQDGRTMRVALEWRFGVK